MGDYSDAQKHLRDSTERQDAWDALPRRRRVLMCARCGWLDAAWEACPPIGRWLDRQRTARRPGAHKYSRTGSSAGLPRPRRTGSPSADDAEEGRFDA